MARSRVPPPPTKYGATMQPEMQPSRMPFAPPTKFGSAASSLQRMFDPSGGGEPPDKLPNRFLDRVKNTGGSGATKQAIDKVKVIKYATQHALLALGLKCHYNNIGPIAKRLIEALGEAWPGGVSNDAVDQIIYYLVANQVPQNNLTKQYFLGVVEILNP